MFNLVRADVRSPEQGGKSRASSNGIEGWITERHIEHPQWARRVGGALECGQRVARIAHRQKDARPRHVDEPRSRTPELHVANEAIRGCGVAESRIHVRGIRHLARDRRCEELTRDVGSPEREVHQGSEIRRSEQRRIELHGALTLSKCRIRHALQEKRVR